MSTRSLPLVSRRTFGEIVLALGVSSCRRAPDEKIVPYVDRPPEVTPGRATRYATTALRRGHGIGVIVECHGGRPTKLEGNPEHPASLGATGVPEQAALVELYDERRLASVRERGITSDHRALFGLLGDRQRLGRIAVLLPQSTSGLLASSVNALRHRVEKVSVHFRAPEAGFGERFVPVHDLSRADRILSLGSDFLAAEGPMDLAHMHELGKRRALRSPTDEPPRLYVVESSLSVSGASADHRIPLESSRLPLFAGALLARLTKIPVPEAVRDFARGEHAHLLEVIARDLKPGRSVVLADTRAPRVLQLLCRALNRALGAEGTLVRYVPNALLASDDGSERELAQALDAGRVDTLIVVGENPVVTAGADLDFGARIQRARERIHVTLREDETSEHATWVVPGRHFLERWGDARAVDGTQSLLQPLLTAPGAAFDAPTLLGAIVPDAALSERERLRRYVLEAGWSDHELERGLERGWLASTAFESEASTGDSESVEAALAGLAAKGAGLVVELRRGRLGEGEHRDNAWLRELPDPITRLSWTNALLLAPKLARRLEIEDGELVRIRTAHGEATIAATIAPGQVDNVASAWLGFDPALDRLRTSGSPWTLHEVQLERTGKRGNLARVQSEDTQHDRPLGITLSLAEWRKNPGALARLDQDPPSIHPRRLGGGPQWAMLIDLNRCTGCSVCVIACQAENNIPSVGPADVALGRAMHWLRIDRYFDAESDNPRTLFQPMACQHCEKAPCEYVCPVGATTHSPDGLNEMTYNRCVGTRFCSSNCPYKVRRFNWRKYGTSENDRASLAANPNVTVRGRGVMEKCTYCVQRIRRAEIDARLAHRPLADGDVVTACQSACPTGAIHFGSLEGGRMASWRSSPRVYGVLADIGTRPRTRYLARITHSNPELET